MKRPNRTIGYILTIMVGIGAIMWTANYWVTNRIKSMLDQQVAAGNLRYESFSGNIFTNQVRLQQVRWLTEGSTPRSDSWSFDQVYVSGFDFFNYIINDEIILNKITLSTPDAILYKHSRDSLDQTAQTEKPRTTTANIFIKQLELTDGNLLLIGKDTSQSILSGQIPFLRLEDIRIDSTTIGQSLPFNCAAYKISGHQLSYRMSDLYDLKVRNLDASDDQLVMDSLEIESPYDKREFQNHVPYEKAWLNLLVPKIELAKTRMDINTDTIGFSAEMASLYEAQLNIYKDNRQPLNPHFKPLYSKMLRELPIKINIDSVQILDADINFQVQTKEEPPPGIVYFQNVDGTIYHLSNTGMDQPNFQETQVYARTNFMGKANFELDWSFDVRDLRDAFLVSGKLSRVSDEEINYFVTPTINIETEGAIEQLAFNFAGNNTSALGDMYVNYDDLRINLLKKDGTRRHPWISGIINFILNNRLDGPVEEKGLTVERVQTKSFWHFLWAMVREGSLETVK